jgi:hypothetical protein
MEYLIAAVINSFYIVGLWYSFQEGQIFEQLNPYPYINKWKPDNVFLKQLFKPIIGCIVCMASVHGIIFFICWNKFIQPLDFHLIIFYICAVAGINRLLYNLADL